MATKKYRPYFTLQELKTLVECVPNSGSHSSLHRYISGYILQISSGMREHNHILEPSMGEKLGLDTGENSVSDSEIQKAESELMAKMSKL